MESASSPPDWLYPPLVAPAQPGAMGSMVARAGSANRPTHEDYCSFSHPQDRFLLVAPGGDHQRIECLSELPGGLKSGSGVERQRLLQDGLERFGHLRLHRARCRAPFGGAALMEIGVLLAHQGAPATHQLGEDKSQCVDVGPGASGAVTFRPKLLGSAILWRERAEAAGSPRGELSRRLAFLHCFCDAEIENLQDHSVVRPGSE